MKTLDKTILCLIVCLIVLVISSKALACEPGAKINGYYVYYCAPIGIGQSIGTGCCDFPPGSCYAVCDGSESWPPAAIFRYYWEVHKWDLDINDWKKVDEFEGCNVCGEQNCSMFKFTSDYTGYFAVVLYVSVLVGGEEVLLEYSAVAFVTVTNCNCNDYGLCNGYCDEYLCYPQYCCGDGTCKNCCGDGYCSTGQHCCNQTGCYQCCDDSHCAAQGKVCDTVNHQCIPCDASHPCPSGYCLNGTCVECMSRDDCGCGQCCNDYQCGECTCTYGRKYVRASKIGLYGILGVSATIKTRYGELCGIPGTSTI